MLKYWDEEDEPPAEPTSPNTFYVAPPKPVIEVGFKKDRRKPQTTSKKRRRPVKELLYVLRSNRCCLLALGLDDSAQDINIIQALLRVEEKESFFRNAGASDDVAKRISEFYQAGEEDISEFALGFLRRSWRIAIQLLLLVTVLFVIAALVVWFSSLDWVKGRCQVADFTNGTCNHGNECRLQIATQTKDGIAYVNNFVMPVVSKRDASSNGLKIYDAAGAFRCCNYAQLALVNDEIPEVVDLDESTLGVGFGSGTPCCNFYNNRFKVFCDNFGSLAQFDHCPMSPWDCRLFMEPDEQTGQPIVARVQVWEDPWTLILILCATGVFVIDLMVVAFGLACKHSDRLYRVGIRMSYAWERLQQRIRLVARLRACCLRFQRCCRRALRMDTKSQDRALRREEKMRQLTLMVEQKLREDEEAELELQGLGTKGSKEIKEEDEPSFGTLKRGNIKEEKMKREKAEAAKALAVKKLAAKELRKMFRQSRKKKSSNLRILENDGHLPPPGQELSRSAESFYTAESSSEEEDRIHPWDFEETLEDVEEDLEEPGSRPATKSLQSMLRPIMTPMQPQRSPRYVTKKFGWQDFSSTTNSFATATSYPTSYGTDALGTSMGSFSRGDAMAQTFTEGFGAGGRSHVGQRNGRVKKSRRQEGKSRRGKARIGWQSPSTNRWKEHMNETGGSSSKVAW